LQAENKMLKDKVESFELKARVSKLEAENNAKDEDITKLKKEVDAMKAKNHGLIIENNGLKVEIFKLKVLEVQI
jgi:regulator of replication initiation timing